MMPSRHGQAARQVRQQLFARQVSLADGEGGRLSVTCLIAKEIAAPDGVKPVEWRLLGGFLGRKGDGEPGVKTLWLGFQRIRDFVEGVEHMRSINAI